MNAGSLILHGGGEAMSGDEPTARLALRLAAVKAASPSTGAAPSSDQWTDDVQRPLRVAILPLATARGRPQLTTAHLTTFLGSLAVGEGVVIVVEGAPIVDRSTAGEATIVRTLRDADLIVLPGGDPDLLPTVLPRTAAWHAIVEARETGTVIWGASAGAMALGEWCWTPDGGQTGLALVPGVAVAPHVEDGASAAWLRRLATRPPKVGVLTLAERTSIVGPVEAPAGEGSPGTTLWRCVGPGVAAWIPAGSTTPTQRATHGEHLRLPR